MTGPIRGAFTLRCNSCQAVAYSSDQGPPTDRIAELVRFADTQCPRGGTAGGCPNTTEARQAGADRKPGRLRQLIAELEALASTLSPIAMEAGEEHRALTEADARLWARIEQVAATLTGQVDTHTGQIATHDGQVATHTGQLATHDGQISTLVGQVAALQARRPVIRVSRAQSLPATTINAVRPLTFTWPTAMPNTNYDVTLTDERLTITATTAKSSTSATVTTVATATFLATTISAVASGWP